MQQNHLIGQLPPEERDRLLAVAEPVQFVLPAAVCERGTPLGHVYFPVDGFVSLLTSVDTHPGLEVGMVGREGMLGVWLALGVRDTPLRAIVQGSGSAWRIAASPFRRVLRRSPALRRVIECYLYVLMAQLAASAACLRFHRLEHRLARWLLMTQDRAHASRFHITHDLLACMLGVRRVGVTLAAGTLQKRGLIAYHRGEVVVLDRAGLESGACSCYAANRQIYAAVMDRAAA